MPNQRPSWTSKFKPLSLKSKPKEEGFFNPKRRSDWARFLREYRDEILAYTWETRQQREQVWQRGATSMFPRYVKPLTEKMQEELLRPCNSELDVAKFYRALQEANDPFHVWLVEARCVSYRFDGTKLNEIDMQVLRLSIPRLADDLLGSNISNNTIERMWTHTLSKSYEIDVLESRDCSLCGQSFEVGDNLMQLPCGKHHEVHQSCIKPHFVKNNECPDCKEIIYPEKERFK